MTSAELGRATRPGVVSPSSGLEGALRTPADKSVSHRALLFNAMAEGVADVSLYRPGDDVRSMVGALEALGAVSGIEHGPDEILRVSVRGGGTMQLASLPGAGGETLDCGNAGTAMRLLIGALTTRAGSATLIGDESLSARPMERVAAPLRAAGARVDTTAGHAPVRVAGGHPIRATRHELTVASAQVIGCLCLASLVASGTTVIRSPGPTRDHTERMLAWLGAPVRRDGTITTVDGPAGFAARSVEVPGDISAAAAWLVAGALHPAAHIIIENVGLNPSRTGVIDVLRDMGADIKVAASGPTERCPEPTGTVTVTGGRTLHGIDLRGDRVADVIDELPLIAVAMAAADGTSTLADAAELRVKESDRISLVVENLKAIGALAEERPDGWTVARGAPQAAAIRTAGDHRIAMAFAVAAVSGVAGTVEVDDPGCAAVSYPAFWQDMERLIG